MRISGRATVAALLLGCLLAAGCSLIFPFEDYGPPKPGASDGGDSGAAGACPSGQKECAAGCVPADDPAFGCGGPSCDPCSIPYADAVECREGACAVTACAPMRADCNNNAEDGCEADLLAPASCGACNVVCSAANGKPYCLGDAGCTDSCGTLVPCSGSCVDLESNAMHCGACDRACAGEGNAVPACTNRTCLPRCNVGFDRCPLRDGRDAGCVPQPPYYVDVDMDTYGGAKAGAACTAPAGHTQTPGDCKDDNPSVKPVGAIPSDTGYTLPDGGVSFDYDCNGVETAATSYQKGKCDVTGCIAGYVPTLRSGVNIDPYCGSKTMFDCASAFPTCSKITPAEGYRCY